MRLAPHPNDVETFDGAPQTTYTRPMTDEVTDKPFWQVKTLEQMTPTEWESLCDGCGRCCLNKLEEEDTGKIFYTSVGCRLFDDATCRCKDYPNRQAFVED